MICSGVSPTKGKKTVNLIYNSDLTYFSENAEIHVVHVRTLPGGSTQFDFTLGPDVSFGATQEVTDASDQSIWDVNILAFSDPDKLRTATVFSVKHCNKVLGP